MINAKYGAPRSVFYLTCELELANLTYDRLRFAGYKAYYTLLYINALKAELAAIKLMPDNIINIAVSKEDRILMIPMVDTLMYDFMDVRNYIRPTCDGNVELYDTRILSAGQSFFERASSYKWSSVNSVNVAMANYLSENSVAMLAGENMPAGFQAQVLLNIGAYNDIFSKYGTDKGDTKTGNVDKVDAENAFYDKITAINEDGYGIARGNKAFEQRYTWSRNVTACGGHLSLSYFKGDTTTGVAHHPLEANIFIEELDMNFQANAKGKFHSAAFAAGKYTIIITCEGYYPITLTEVDIHLHTSVTRRLVMVPLIMEDAKKLAKAKIEAGSEEEKVEEVANPTSPPPAV